MGLPAPIAVEPVFGGLGGITRFPRGSPNIEPWDPLRRIVLAALPHGVDGKLSARYYLPL